MFLHISSLKPNQKQDYKGNLSSNGVAKAMTEVGLTPSRLNFELSFEKKGDFIELEGHIAASITLECVRCLKTFEYQIDEPFRLFLYKEDEEFKEKELSEDDLEFSIVHSDKLELADILREQILLKLPDYPRCDAPCQAFST